MLPRLQTQQHEQRVGHISTLPPAAALSLSSRPGWWRRLQGSQGLDRGGFPIRGLFQVLPRESAFHSREQAAPVCSCRQSLAQGLPRLPVSLCHGASRGEPRGEAPLSEQRGLGVMPTEVKGALSQLQDQAACRLRQVPLHHLCSVHIPQHFLAAT